jgi:hypothetical protein
VAVATLKDGQNLNFAVPSNYLSQLSPSATVAKPLAIPKSGPGKARSIGAPLTEGVIAHTFAWGAGSDGYFTLSLVNKLRDPVGNVSCLVVFRNKEGLPLDTAKVFPANISFSISSQVIRIEPGAAVRVAGKIDYSIVQLVAHYEARIINFEVLH